MIVLIESCTSWFKNSGVGSKDGKNGWNFHFEEKNSFDSVRAAEFFQAVWKISQFLPSIDNVMQCEGTAS
jgi:hypothetical protein